MIRIAVKLFLRVGFILLTIQSAFSQGRDLKKYAITQFSMEDGLPQSTVSDIIQTQDGYIWLATFGGLVRFDGNSFTTFNRSNTPGMDSDRLLKIYGDKEGGIWLFPEAAETEVYRFKDGKCTKFSLNSNPFGILSINEDKNGTVWIKKNEGVWQYADEKLRNIPISTDPDVIEQVLRDSEGVWIGYGNSVLKTANDRVALVFDSLLKNQVFIVQIIEHPSHPDRLLIGTSGNGVFEIGKDGKLISTYNLQNKSFIRFEIGNDKTIFGVTAQGITYLDDGMFKDFEPLNSKDEIGLRSILQDNEGNYWVGSNGDGLFKLRKTVITMIDQEDGLENEKMLSLTKLDDGTMLFSTNCGGVFEWRNNKATFSTVHSFFKSPCNWSVFQDSKNRIWIGGSKPYVTNALDEPGREFGDKEGFTGYGVFAIMEDSKAQIWIGSANGIFVFKDDFFTSYTTKQGLYTDHTSTLFEDDAGVIWAGTKSGLNTIKNGKVKKIALLVEPPASKKRQPWVRAIHQDKSGVMWFGTYGMGLFSLQNGEITHLTTESGLYDNIISNIVEDKEGNFWMGSNRGISRVRQKELIKFIHGEIKQVKSYSYGASEGMNSAETNGGFQPNTIVDSLGNIYFPTVAGVAVVSTDDVKQNEIPPPVTIERVRTNEEEIPISSLITLPYDNPYLEIDYTALSFIDPKKVRFKYRMKGLSDTWMDVGNRRSVLYSKVPPGNYTFQVIASNNDGVWNRQGASLAIRVIPPFWETLWFYTLLSILFVSTGPAIYYVRVNRLKKENERAKRFTEQLIDSQEQERRRIASELHDGLGQQILVIKNRAELAQQQTKTAEALTDQLHEIMQSAVCSIEDIRSISHGLRPVHLEKFGLTEAVTNLCDQLKSTSPMEWSYHIDNIDEIIPKKSEIHFYRVLQEGTNNIIKHSSATEASIIVRKTEKGIKAVLWDDGIGFNMKEKGQLGGLGFLGMHERMETLGGTLEVQSTINEGTTIKIFISIPKNG